MNKSGSVINVPALCFFITTFLGDVLLRIFQKEKIGPKIVAKITCLAAALVFYVGQLPGYVWSSSHCMIFLYHVVCIRICIMFFLYFNKKEPEFKVV